MRDTQVSDEIVEEAEDIAPPADAANGPVDDEASVAVESDDRIGDLQRELTLERDKYLRLAAEFDNFRKRMTKERFEAEARGQGELVRHMLDPLDDIGRRSARNHKSSLQIVHRSPSMRSLAAGLTCRPVAWYERLPNRVKFT